MREARRFFLVHADARKNAMRCVAEAPAGHQVIVQAPKRSLDQNAKFHALCSDIARAGFEWAGKKRDAAAVKVLLVSGHAVATNESAEIVTGLEGELVNLRESTAAMSKKRGSSLIEYTLATCAQRGIEVNDGGSE